MMTANGVLVFLSGKWTARHMCWLLGVMALQSKARGQWYATVVAGTMKQSLNCLAMGTSPSPEVRG